MGFKYDNRKFKYGLDTLVFTAGIGENSASIRNLICEPLAWLGIELNDAANSASLNKISNQHSKVDVHIIPTNEQAMIAMSAAKLLEELR